MYFVVQYVITFTVVFLLSGFSGLNKAGGVVSMPIRVEDEFTIPWMQNRKLTWGDFQRTPVLHSEAVASTSTSLGLTYKMAGNDFQYSIACNFTKHKSWGLLKTDYILAHEQAHFDITELFARKLYQALQQYQLNPRSYKKDVSQIYQEIVKQKEAFQHSYDKETDHSRNRKQQNDWLEKIDDLLQETSAYSAYP